MKIDEILSENILVSKHFKPLLEGKDKKKLTGKELKKLAKLKLYQGFFGDVLGQKLSGIKDDEVYTIKTPTLATMFLKAL